MEDLVQELSETNHNIWLTHFIHNAQDVYPLLGTWIEARRQVLEQPRGRAHSRHPDVGARFTSTACSASYPSATHPGAAAGGIRTDIATKKHWFGEPWGAAPRHRTGDLLRGKLDSASLRWRAWPTIPKPASSTPSARAARAAKVPIIDGLVNDEGYFQVNVPNYGALPGVPDDVVVEVRPLVNKKGIQPIRVEPLPTKIMLEQILPEWMEMESASCWPTKRATGPCCSTMRWKAARPAATTQAGPCCG
ncbi:MAG: hypothetical protein R2851_27990 [Caldilineaceae bacterium]